MDETTKKILFVVGLSGLAIPLYLFAKLHILVLIFSIPLLISGIIIGYWIRDYQVKKG